MIHFIPGIAVLAKAFDAFMLDLWGVIHDGQKLYPGAKECLEHLRADGKKIVLLSNAPRRAAVAIEALRRMGINDDAYDALITSGEAAYQCLADKNADYFHPAGNRYIYIGLERDRRLLEGLNYYETGAPSSAHFLLMSHSYVDNQPLSELEPLLEKCLMAKLPALCVNPDMEVVRQTGERVYCAGVIAAEYAQRGGEVIYFGKPQPIVYDMAFAVLKDIARNRILAIGDNLATDILGANRVSLKSALITGGVLKQDVGEPGAGSYLKCCEDLFEKTKISPDYVLGSFQ